jgi:hypothetical protein
MAWVAPILWATGYNSDKTVTTLLNEEVRDHMNETMPAKATAKGNLFVATAANAIAALTVGANDTVLVAASGQATGLNWVATPSHSH